MKHITLLLVLLLTATLGVQATPTAEAAGNEHINPTFGYGNSFIFVENGITFSVFPDGEFDFYVNDMPYGSHANVSFNAGCDYNSYLQYDDYGAVIQIVNTPIFYDYYGRVAQIGAVRIFYNNHRVIRIGGLHIFYNPHGMYSHCSGYINVYNRVYVYRPFHRFFIRPVTQFCMVSYLPYRQYYAPVRYTYCKPYINNVRKCYASVGTTYYYKENNSRRGIYKNDKRVTVSSYNAHPAKVSRRSEAQQQQQANKVSKRGNAQSYENNKKVNTPSKRYKTPAGTIAPSQRNAVPSKRGSQKPAYKPTTSGRSTKAVKTTAPKKRAASGTHGNRSRSGM